MKTKLLLVFILSGLTQNNLFAQNEYINGYIITLENDTVPGHIDYQNNSKNYTSCLFETGDGQIEYSPDQIKGFGFYGYKTFRSQIVPETFVEILITGEISLFKAKNNFILQKNDEIFPLIPPDQYGIYGMDISKNTNKWKGIISYLISDCYANSNEVISRISLSEKDLTQLVIDYHNCKGIPFDEYKSDQPWSQIELGLALGMVGSSLYPSEQIYSFYNLKEKYTALAPSFGLVANIHFPRLSKSLSIQGELHFFRHHYNSFVKVEDKTIEYFDTHIDVNTVSVPLALKYTFSNIKNAPFLQGGILYNFHPKSHASVLREAVTDHIVTTYPKTEVFEVKKHQFGIWSGVGFEKSFDRFTASINLRYSLSSYLSVSDYHDTSINNYSISIILFKQ